MNYSRKHFILVLLLASAATNATFADSKQQEGEALIARAKQLSAIRGPGNPAFRLKAQFRFSNPKPGEGEGSYLEVWASPQQWHREVSVGDYHQVEVGGENKRWVLHDLSFESLRLLKVTELLALGDLDLQLEVKRIYEGIKAGIRVRCVQGKAREEHDEVFCFDSASGSLVSTDDRSHGREKSYEYFDYGDFANHRYPRKILALSDRKMSLEVEVTDLSLEPAPQESLFVPTAGSRELPVCNKMEPPKALSAPDPIFPAGQTGNATVVLWTVVGIDGKPSDLRVARSMGNGFDNAALEAVRRWTFRPAICGGQPVAVQINIEVAFHR